MIINGWDLSKQAGIRDTIISNLGLPSYVEQEVDETLQEHGDSSIESLLDGKSAMDTILGDGMKNNVTISGD